MICWLFLLINCSHFCAQTHNTRQRKGAEIVITQPGQLLYQLTGKKGPWQGCCCSETEMKSLYFNTIDKVKSCNSHAAAFFTSFHFQIAERAFRVIEVRRLVACTNVCCTNVNGYFGYMPDERGSLDGCANLRKKRSIDIKSAHLHTDNRRVAGERETSPPRMLFPPPRNTK